MKHTHFIILVSLIGFITSNSIAQQDAQYTQYMYNTISVNPAYAGSRGVMSITGLHRSQWVGLEGAPKTQTLSLNTPIGNRERTGLGFSIVNDEIGPSQETYFDVDFSYTIPVSREGNLSFGLKAGLHLLDVDFRKLDLFNENDNLLTTNIDNNFSPKVGLGVYYYDGRFYAGLSVPNVLETNHFDESSISSSSSASSFLAEERINYYLISGYVFDLSDTVKFKPAVLSKLVFGAPLQVDVSANFLFNDKFSLGAAYRWSAALSALVGFQVSDSIMLGFAYDSETTDLGKTQINNGSYEVFLRFEVFKRDNRILTPRFF